MTKYLVRYWPLPVATIIIGVMLMIISGGVTAEGFLTTLAVALGFWIGHSFTQAYLHYRRLH